MYGSPLVSTGTLFLLNTHTLFLTPIWRQVIKNVYKTLVNESVYLCRSCWQHYNTKSQKKLITHISICSDKKLEIFIKTLTIFHTVSSNHFTSVLLLTPWRNLLRRRDSSADASLRTSVRKSYLVTGHWRMCFDSIKPFHGCRLT